jgi:hypothetical protein
MLSSFNERRLQKRIMPMPDKASPHALVALGLAAQRLGRKYQDPKRVQHARAVANQALQNLQHQQPAPAGFDETTYDQTKPLFRDAASEFAGSYKDVGELARKLVDELKAAGYSMDLLRNMRPYLERFVQDVKDGAIKLAQSAD